MVRAIRAGEKTQTRRPMYRLTSKVSTAQSLVVVRNGVQHDTGLQMPLPTFNHAWTLTRWKDVHAGDRLWVRETWIADPKRDGTWPHVAFDGCKPRDMSLIPERFRTPAHALYRADGHDLHGWTPGIHMPRWACREVLYVTRRREERLQEISEADCIAEGIKRYRGPMRWVKFLDAITGEPVHNTARDAYFALWEHLHGAGSVDDNPWLFAFDFTRAPR